MKKAIFFDIDGTIIDTFNGKNEMSSKVKMAIRELQEAGHYAFIATGRPYAFISDMLWEFGFDGFVLSNGAQVIINGKTVYEDTMDSGFVQELVKEFDKHKMNYVLEGEYDSYFNCDDKKFHDFFRSINISERHAKIGSHPEDAGIYKVEILCQTEEIEEICKKFVDNYPEYDYYQSISGVLLEIYAKRNHKAKGIMKALEILHIDIEDSYAFGDGINDIEMLESVGCGIAMGNASDEVKSHAKYVTDTVINDGVAVGINKYILLDKADKAV